MSGRKVRLLLSVLLAAFVIASCGNTAKQNTEDMETTRQTEQTPNPKATTQETLTAGEHTLIAYFTWADNTIVENPEDIDIDATTSASVLAPGNAALLASWIQEETGGDLFSIVVEEPYSSDYDECLDRASEERAQNARPKIVNHVENMEQYDTVFLGFPNWWYGAPMPVLSFLEEYDFSGKTIIPFITHGTGGLAQTIEDIEEVLPDEITMLEPIGIYRPEVKNSKEQIKEWIESMNIDFTENSGESERGDEKERIRISFDDNELILLLEDNSASQDLLQRLPISVKFEDYNATEKIAYMEDALDISAAPDNCTPSAGTFAFYVPWGNLSLFYENFRESDQLVPLGAVEVGLDNIKLIEDGTEVLIERVD